MHKSFLPEEGNLGDTSETRTRDPVGASRARYHCVASAARQIDGLVNSRNQRFIHITNDFDEIRIDEYIQIDEVAGSMF